MAISEAPSAEVKPSRLRMTYEEFLEWSDEDTHAEWVEGEVVVLMPPKDIHQATLAFLYELLSLFVRLFKLGQLRIAPFEMRAVPGGSAREPDILFVAKENLDRITEERLAGPADLVIEVVSDDSVRRDRHEKLREYEAAGIQEYWIIDPRPEKQRADFYRLDQAGAYELFATEDDAKVTATVLPGFWLRPAWLWQIDALDPLTCCLEIEGVVEALSAQIEQTRRSGSVEPED